MSKYFVKDKYTYEKVRQTDWSYQSGRTQLSQNNVSGRFIYSTDGVILAADSICAEAPLKTAVNADFSQYTGFEFDYAAYDGEADGLCSVTFFKGDKTYQSVFSLKTAGGKAVFDTFLMDFVPEGVLVEVYSGTVRDVKILYSRVLDTLGEYNGQAFFYKTENSKLCDDHGVLSWKLEGRSMLESPEFPDSSATVYNMLMPRRNTVYMVIANHSDSENVKLYYTTTKHPEYSENACVELKLSGEDFRVYYFNLSATENCEGRLRSFKLVAEGKGEIKILRYTFEQEKKIERLGGKIVSCTAVGDPDGKITVKGCLDDVTLAEFAGGAVRVYAASMADDRDTPDGRILLGECEVSGFFTIDSIPFSDGVTSYLPYQFLAFAEKDGKYLKIDDRFYVENYEDFGTNPYSFTLADYEVNALNCGAVGDGFTDDTDAIQKAIDLAAKMGGGRVTIPGDNSFYGRRYIITNLLLRTGVELHIDKGAILWQSQMKREYCYQVTYGHDGVIPGVNWTHCLHVCNLPLIHAHQAKRVKITGFGKIRSMDTGSEEGVDMPGYSTGCPDRIHQITLGFYEVSYAELRDFEIVRANNYHSSAYGCDHIYYANLKLHEVKCVSGDGLGFSSAHDICINRCFFQSNDDGVVFTAVYHDPRGILWWTSRPGEDNRLREFLIEHCYLNSGGGKALAFITWGTSDKIQEREEICDIQAYDNYLVCVNPVGTWPDNPYNGKVPFDNSETDDYSPVRHVRILGNRYVGNCTLGPIHATDVITDCGVHSYGDFRNGDFTLGGFANWNITKNSSDESARTIIYADKEKGALEELGEGGVAAYQGLYLEAGSHTFKAEFMTGESGAYMYVENMDGEVIAEKLVISHYPVIASLDFEITDTQDLYVGVKTAGAFDGFVIFDKCSITSHIDRELINRKLTERYLAGVERVFILNERMVAGVENEKALLYMKGVDSDAMLEARDEYIDLEWSVAIRRDAVAEQNKIAFMFGADHDRTSCYMLLITGADKEMKVLRVSQSGVEVLYKRTNFYFTSLDFHIFGLKVSGGKAFVSVDGSLYGQADLPGYSGGSTALSVSGLDVSLNDLELK